MRHGLSRVVELRNNKYLNDLFSRSDSFQAAIFLLPAMVLLSISFFYPILFHGINLSFREFTLNPNAPDLWIGFDNYAYWLFGDGQEFIWHSAKITLLYVMVVLPLNVVISLSAALIVNESLPAQGFWRGIMLAGYASPAIAGGLVFAIMEQNASYGIIFNTLSIFFDMPASGGLPSNRPWAFWGLVIAQVWRDFGLMYIIILAGLQSIPRNLYEMALVDGAGPLQRFRYITLPRIRSLLLIAMIIRTATTATTLDIPLAITNGGPINYTTFVGVALFKRAFISWNLGRAAAFGIILTIFLLPMIALWLKLETEDFE